MLTIFTPTYNRAHTLGRLFESLCNQTCYDFEWLVVDDGSTDGTGSLFDEWCKEERFPVRYIFKENCGKYRAYNYGLREARGSLFFCVDSDDRILPSTVEQILGYETTIAQDETLAGVVALKCFPDSKVIGRPFSQGIFRCGLFHLFEIGEGGERSIVMKQCVACMFPFPEQTDEKFMGECVVYDRLEEKYQFLVKNDILTECEYQVDGLSSLPFRLMLNNPAGYKLFYSQRIDLTSSLKERIRYAVRYNAFRTLYSGVQFEYVGVHKLCVYLTFLFGVALSWYYRLRA